MKFKIGDKVIMIKYLTYNDDEQLEELPFNEIPEPQKTSIRTKKVMTITGKYISDPNFVYCIDNKPFIGYAEEELEFVKVTNWKERIQE